MVIEFLDEGNDFSPRCRRIRDLLTFGGGKTGDKECVIIASRGLRAAIFLDIGDGPKVVAVGGIDRRGDEGGGTVQAQDGLPLVAVGGGVGPRGVKSGVEASSDEERIRVAHVGEARRRSQVGPFAGEVQRIVAHVAMLGEVVAGFEVAR